MIYVLNNLFFLNAFEIYVYKSKKDIKPKLLKSIILNN